MQQQAAGLFVDGGVEAGVPRQGAGDAFGDDDAERKLEALGFGGRRQALLQGQQTVAERFEIHRRMGQRLHRIAHALGHHRAHAAGRFAARFGGCWFDRRRRRGGDGVLDVSPQHPAALPAARHAAEIDAELLGQFAGRGGGGERGSGGPGLFDRRRRRLQCRRLGERHRRGFDFFALRRDAQENRADLHRIAGLPAQFADHAGARRGQLDIDLVGADGGDFLVFFDVLARFDRPTDQQGLADAFADVGQDKFIHQNSNSMLRLMARPMRPALGL